MRQFFFDRSVGAVRGTSPMQSYLSDRLVSRISQLRAPCARPEQDGAMWVDAELATRLWRKMLLS